MTRNVIRQDHQPALQPVDETVDHVRGSPAGRLILEYVDSGIASGQIRGTPTLFIDRVVYRGSYDAATLLRMLAR
jgi:protein-disulfide isomerase